MSRRRKRPTGRPGQRRSAGPLVRVTEDQLSRDLGVPVTEVEEHLQTAIRAGWIGRLGPGVFVLTIPEGVRLDER
ncbi:hypothetical protein GA0070564_11121 [Micromonospora mirobrigensis]|uniref:Winged helix-turn-helix DNA-binding n=1 Tax=Micromonospora mirobrigensis TaxID=262898 RepID=A0A1C5AIS4_9ACTN|nr:hypothetical protein GA0070564_11121 [Micromonospora mirobrigensis]